MTEQYKGQPEKKVKLVASRGDTSVFIDAEIDERGSLVISGQDIGRAPQECFGDSDYEYWLVVAAADKERVLSILRGQAAGTPEPGLETDASATDPDWMLLREIERRYRGDLRVVSAFRDLLTASGIGFEFRTF